MHGGSGVAGDRLHLPGDLSQLAVEAILDPRLVLHAGDAPGAVVRSPRRAIAVAHVVAGEIGIGDVGEAIDVVGVGNAAPLCAQVGRDLGHQVRGQVVLQIGSAGVGTDDARPAAQVVVAHTGEVVVVVFDFYELL